MGYQAIECFKNPKSKNYKGTSAVADGDKAEGSLHRVGFEGEEIWRDNVCRLCLWETDRKDHIVYNGDCLHLSCRAQIQEDDSLPETDGASTEAASSYSPKPSKPPCEEDLCAFTVRFEEPMSLSGVIAVNAVNQEQGEWEDAYFLFDTCAGEHLCTPKTAQRGWTRGTFRCSPLHTADGKKMEGDEVAGVGVLITLDNGRELLVVTACKVGENLREDILERNERPGSK